MEMLYLISVHFDEVNIDVGFLSDPPSKLHFLYLCVHFPNFSFDVDSLTDAFLDDSLILSVVGFGQVHVLLNSFPVVTHLGLLLESRCEAESCACDGENLNVKGFWLPHILIDVGHRLLRREQVLVEGFKWTQNHVFLVLEVPDVVLCRHFRMRVHAHFDVVALLALELDGQLQRPSMVFRINLTVVSIHGKHVDERALLRGQQSDLLASADELVQLDLGLTDLPLENV